MAADASWLEPLISSFGIPLAVGTFAAALYQASRAAENAASPEAIRDISKALRNKQWPKMLKPAAITEQVFITTFGHRHLSMHCMVGSVLASIVFWFVGSLVLHRINGIPVSMLLDNLREEPSVWLTFIVVLGFVPDYIALWKTRVLLQRWPDGPSSVAGITLVVSDVLLSILIAYIALTVAAIIEHSQVGARVNPDKSFWFFFFEVVLSWNVFDFVVGYVRNAPSGFSSLGGEIWLVFSSSTLLTSIWTALILVSSILIRMVTPLQRFTIWFFDVDKKPIQAIGVVSGALVILGGLVWAVATKIVRMTSL